MTWAMVVGHSMAVYKSRYKNLSYREGQTKTSAHKLQNANDIHTLWGKSHNSSTPYYFAHVQEIDTGCLLDLCRIRNHHNPPWDYCTYFDTLALGLDAFAMEACGRIYRTKYIQVNRL